MSYLQGRIAAFERGRVTLNNVAGAVRVAVRCGVNPDDLRALLDRYRLAWDDQDDRPRLIQR